MPPEGEMHDANSPRRSQISDINLVRLLQGTAYSVAQAPLDATAQMMSKCGDRNVVAPQLCPKASANESDGWWQAGTMVGSVISFIALTKALRFGANRCGLVSVSTPMTACESAAVGATSSILQPMDESNVEGGRGYSPEYFFESKVKGAIASAASFGLMTRTNNAIHNAGFFGRIGRRPILASVGVNGFCGGVGGVADSSVRHVLGDREVDDHAANIASQIAFGALFGVGEGFLARAHVRKLKLDPKDTSPVIPTEKLINDPSINAQEFSSPILTWIAENRPSLRPPNYISIQDRLNSSASAGVLELKLGDWPKEQQQSVLKEVQKLARRSAMASDSNIDTVIEWLPKRELEAFDMALNQPGVKDAYTRWGEASEKLREHIRNNKVFRELEFERVLADKDLHNLSPPLKKLVDDVTTAEEAYTKLVQQAAEATGVRKGLHGMINKVSYAAGLPYSLALKIQANEAGAAYGPAFARFHFGEYSLHGGKTPLGAETVMHETVHHEQGLKLDIFRRPKKHRHYEAQSHIKKEIELLEEPGGTFDLLQRLGRTGTNTFEFLTAGRGLSTEIRSTLRAVEKGKLEQATLDETKVKPILRDLLDRQLRYHQIKAQQNYMRYVGSGAELPAWSVGYITRLRARAAGLPERPLPDDYLSLNPIDISQYKPVDPPELFGGLFGKR